MAKTFGAIHMTDIKGADAVAYITIMDIDNLDSKKMLGTVRVKMKPVEKQFAQDMVDRAVAKMAAREAAAAAKKAAKANAKIDLSQPIPGEVL